MIRGVCSIQELDCRNVECHRPGFPAERELRRSAQGWINPTFVIRHRGEYALVQVVVSEVSGVVEGDPRKKSGPTCVIVWVSKAKCMPKLMYYSDEPNPTGLQSIGCPTAS